VLALQGYYRINKSNHEDKHSKLELKRRIASKQAKENQNNYKIFVLTGSNLNTSCSNEGQGFCVVVAPTKVKVFVFLCSCWAF
jgi:hypothetical protein